MVALSSALLTVDASAHAGVRIEFAQHATAAAGSAQIHAGTVVAEMRRGPGVSDTPRVSAKKLRRARATVMAVALQQSSYTGAIVKRHGRVLRLYGVSKAKGPVKHAMRRARSRAGLVVTWRATAAYPRHELTAAAATIRRHTGVARVILQPKCGCLAIITMDPNDFRGRGWVDTMAADLDAPVCVHRLVTNVVPD